MSSEKPYFLILTQILWSELMAMTMFMYLYIYFKYYELST